MPRRVPRKVPPRLAPGPRGGWREQVLRRYGIAVLQGPAEPDPSVFWATRCARVKADVAAGRADELYRSPVTGRFFRFVRRHGLRFGVLSDLYGLHLDRERLAAYDVHPSQLDAGRKRELGAIIGRKVRAEGFDRLVFVNNSPVRSKPYFEMLAASGLGVTYATRVALGDRS
jgi:hypothetical protein